MGIPSKNVLGNPNVMEGDFQIALESLRESVVGSGKAYDSANTYAQYDTCVSGGITYYSKVNGNIGNAPAINTYWGLKTDLLNAVLKVTTTDNCIMRADGAAGNIQPSGVYVDDNGKMSIGFISSVGKLNIAGNSPYAEGAFASAVGTIVVNEGGLSSLNNTGGLEFKNSVYGLGYGSKILSTDNGQLLFGTRNNSTSFIEAMRIDTDRNIISGADNTQSLGSATHRWSVIYAGSGTINTSDEREKTFYATTEAEKQVAQELRTIIKKFRFNDAIAQKGEDTARLHFGVGAQTVVATFSKYGLDANKYALLCYDEWGVETEKVEAEDGDIIETVEVQKTKTVQKTKQEIKIVDGTPTLVLTTEEVEEPVYEEIQVVDTDGTPLVNEDDTPVLYKVPIMESVTKKYKNVVKREAGNRYGIRYEELAMFILGA